MKANGTPMVEQWDAFGQEIYALWQGETDVVEIIERDDNYVDLSVGPTLYFAPYEEWPDIERDAITLARGRVLDVGCGAGRVALYLQEEGHEVVAIDNSPLAIDVCRQRGVTDARLMSITETGKQLGQFDTIVMFGNNFGLFGSPERARWLLRRWKAMTTPEARIIAETLDPTQTSNPDHLSYHERNRQRGRLPGQVRIRVRFRRAVGNWFDYLFVSREEMAEIVAGTGWRVVRTVDSPGPGYIAVLEKSS